MSRLREDGCGVECGGDTIPGLLFADDTPLLASDKEGLRKSLDVLVQWCEDRGIRINAAKCGIMHIRKKKVMRNEIRYMIDGEEILMVSCYKYLQCVVDEHLDLKEMVQDKVVAGKKALGAWFQWCRVEVGDIGIGTFKKLMSSLVESSILYGTEIWGCSRKLCTRYN